MKYTVKAGDTLSQILKNLEVSSYASSDTWSKVKTASGSPHLIRVGETLDLSKVPGLASSTKTSTQKATQAPSATKTPSRDISEKVVAETAPPRERFEDVYGQLHEFMPEAAFTQFAAQQANPFHFRDMVRQTQDYERGLGLSGAWRTGYGDSGRTDLLNQLESQRKEAMQPFIQQQRDYFTDWYGAEKKRYETTDDPGFSLDRAGLGGAFGGKGFAPSAKAHQYTYNPLDLTKYLRPSISGYGAAPNMDKLYGTIK